MNRRDFLQTTGAVCAGLAFSKSLPGFADALATGGWRTFEVTSRVEVLKPNGVTHIWLPAALIRDTPYQRTLSNKFSAETGTAKLTKDKPSALGIVSATYPANAKPVLTLTSRVSTRPYAVDLTETKPAPSQRASKAELDFFLQPTKYVPNDGIVKETALKATAGATTDIEKAHAIYEWVVDNTFRDPKVRGCGRGDIRAMLESGDFGGKCADLNALYVWHGTLSRYTGAAYLRLADCEIRPWIQEPGSEYRQSHQRTALPLRSLSDATWLGACRPGGRAQGGSGGAAGKPQTD